MQPTGTRSWGQRFVIRGRCELGLGGFSLVPLKGARAQALANCRLARAGGDPLTEKRHLKSMPNFVAAEAVLGQMRPDWRNPKHGQDWLSSMERFVFPHLGKLPVSEVISADMGEALRAVWHERPATARTRPPAHQQVVEWAVAMNYRDDTPCSRIGPVLGPHRPSRSAGEPGVHAARSKPWKRPQQTSYFSSVTRAVSPRPPLAVWVASARLSSWARPKFHLAAPVGPGGAARRCAEALGKHLVEVSPPACRRTLRILDGRLQASLAAASLRLRSAERSTLTKRALRATVPYRAVTRAKALLRAGDGAAHSRLATPLASSRPTALHGQARFLAEGLEAVGAVRPGRGRKPRVTTHQVQAPAQAAWHETPPT